jgi:hypothetical protein
MEIPGLDEVTLNALDLHASYEIPSIRLDPARKRLVIASGNALPTGRVLFADEGALFCDEGQYRAVLEREPEVDSAVVISASGTKHAPLIVREMLDRGLSTYLVTCNAKSPAGSLLPAGRVLETRSNPEPITYNTSTYMGMMLAKTREDAAAIKRHLLEKVAPLIPDFNEFEAFYLMVRPAFDVELEMFVTKFDELFGGRVNGRCYTTEQTLHAKTVVPWDKELFISFGVKNEDFGAKRLDIPLPEPAGFVTMLATGYYVIGHIQKQKPAWFKQNAEEYARIQKALFEKHKT